MSNSSGPRWARCRWGRAFCFDRWRPATLRNLPIHLPCPSPSPCPQPAWPLKLLLRRVDGHLRSLTPTKAYNMLHLRAESDWWAVLPRLGSSTSGLPCRSPKLMLSHWQCTFRCPLCRLAHCARWEHIPDGMVRDNCMNNTDSVAEQLALHEVNTQVRTDSVSRSYPRTRCAVVLRAPA